MNRKIHNDHLPPCCGECSFFKDEDIFGHGYCDIAKHEMDCEFGCLFMDMNPTDKETERILHHFNKWRRGCKTEKRMAHPWIIGLALDSAIKIIRKQRKEHCDQESI